jgi:hypothetical protein
MVGTRGNSPWILRVALLFGLLGALCIATPNAALAKPFPTEPGPTESGDPTADDVPSPTPKPKAHAPHLRVSMEQAAVRTSGTIVRVPWKVYLRLLVHFRTW